MLFAKVVFGLPLDGPFDYIVPPVISPKIKEGSRVWVSFGHKKIVGYVVGLTDSSRIKNLKTIIDLIDEIPILDKDMLLLTKELAGYYCCSWGEAIETALPEGLRKGKALSILPRNSTNIKSKDNKVLVMQDLEGSSRWGVYLTEIQKTLLQNKSVIVILPDKESLTKAKEFIDSHIKASVACLFRKEPNELSEWSKIKNNQIQIVLGTRSAVFAPMPNLGLLIINEERDSVYKQDQVPHYHAREVALMRSDIDEAGVILGGNALSLEAINLFKEHKAELLILPRKREYPEVKIFNVKDLAFLGRKKGILLTKYIEDSIMSTFNTKGKTLLFLNRKGFATYAFCQQCAAVLKCPRCNVNLAYHFKENILTCHYCNYKITPPNICPDCNSGYIKYSGSGTEKIESELCRIFPQARIKIIEGHEEINLDSADIFISTSLIIKHPDKLFDLVCVLSIDNSLNRPDLRSGEKVFGILLGLLNLANKRLIIQTRLHKHRAFEALLKAETGIFYNAELKERKQLGFPPYRHLGLAKLRGKNETRVREASEALFTKLSKSNKGKSVKVLSVNPAQNLKLRGNFYWQVLLSAKAPQVMADFLKINLKSFRHSGIIVTVDIDPI